MAGHYSTAARAAVNSKVCLTSQFRGNKISTSMGRKFLVQSEHMKRLSIDSTDVAYFDNGEGEAVFLVHAGVFSDWFLPVSETPALRGFRVVRVRRAGYGDSIPAHHLTVADHARHVAALADHLGLDRIHWVGHSSSCQMGLQLAVDYPNLVASLVLIEPAAAGGLTVPASENFGRQFVGPAMAAFAAGNTAEAFDIFMMGVCGDAYRSVLADRLGSDGLQRAIRESAFFFRDEISAVLESRFGEFEAVNIHQPILVVKGAENAGPDNLFHQVTELAHKLLPRAETAIVDGTNHLMPLQAPDAVGHLIQKFINSCA